MADRRRDRHGHPGRSHPVSGAARNLYSRPTLIWTLDNRGGAQHRVEASYLAGKLSWQADYVLTVGRDDKLADLDGWVTLTNGSGTSFRNAKLQFVAGELNRVRPMLDKDARGRHGACFGGIGARDVAGSVFRLPPLHARAEDLGQQQRDQAGQHAERHRFPVQKRYVVDGQAFYYHNAQHPWRAIKDVVQVFYQFKNEEKAGLGMPMPAGTCGSTRPTRRAACSSWARIASITRRRTKRSTSRSAMRLTSSASGSRPTSRRSRSDVYEVEYEITLRNHKAIAGRRRGERADWRHLADAAVVARVDEDRRRGPRSSRCRSRPTEQRC